VVGSLVGSLLGSPPGAGEDRTETALSSSTDYTDFTDCGLETGTGSDFELGILFGISSFEFRSFFRAVLRTK
jgi:hypothetical protein